MYDYRLNENILSIYFKTEKAKRTITLNPKKNIMTFKDTIYADMKWATEFDRIEHFAIDESMVFKVKIKERESFEIGKVSKEIVSLLRKHIGDFYK